jgi:hypothetical protein
MTRSNWFAALAILIAAGVVYAPAGALADQCFGLTRVYPPEPIPELAVGHVIGNQRAYFQSEIGSPPQKAYLIPGDTFLAVRKLPGFVCIEYWKQNPLQDWYGWIPENQVKLDAAEDVPMSISGWIGTWNRLGGDATITINAKGSVLQAQGDAIWHGRVMPHFGEFAGKASPVGNVVTFGQPQECQVRLLAIRSLLAAVDSPQCGDTTGSFSGFYVRKKRPAKIEPAG